MNTPHENLTPNQKPFHKINMLYLGGFKAFKNTQKIPIRPITLVFGPNSSGKSSLLKGLLLSLDSANTRIQDTGRQEDLVNKLSSKAKIGFEFNTKITNTDFLRNSSLESLLEWMGDYERNYEKALKDPANYQFIKSSTSIELSALPYGNDLKILHTEMNSKSVIEDSYSVFGDNMPLRIEIQENQVKMIESRFKDLLFESIISNFKSCDFDENYIDFLITCINEEIHKMSVRFDPGSGRILVSRFSSDTQWYRKCLSDLSDSNPTGIESRLNSIIESYNDSDRFDKYWHLTFEYFKPKKITEFNGNVLFTTNHFKNLGETPYSTINTNQRKTKNKKTVIALPENRASQNNDHDLFKIHRNDTIGFRLVYDAVCVILAEINIRYASAFCSLMSEHSPKIKYISATRSFLDDQGRPNSLWDNLISSPQNRNKTNAWLKQLTNHFQISEPSRMFTEAQAILLQSGAARIGDEGFTPIIDNELRITDTRIPSTSFRPQDVGFGIQKLVPVVAAAVYSNPLTLDESKSNETIDVVAIEEPEMHLHPKLQSDLGDLFVDNVINNSEKTFIIETHSEHLLLRILKRVRKRELSRDSVSVLYVHPGTNDSGANVEHLEIDEDGDFLKPWPPGFFDVRRENLV